MNRHLSHGRVSTIFGIALITPCILTLFRMIPAWSGYFIVFAVIGTLFLPLVREIAAGIRKRISHWLQERNTRKEFDAWHKRRIRHTQLRPERRSA